MKARHIITEGEKYGKLIICKVETIKGRFNTKKIAHCICECGNHCDKQAWELLRGTNLHCGCSQRNKLIINEGDRFGRLLVMEVTIGGSGKGMPPSLVRCKCDCGSIINIQAIKLWSKTSCGCKIHNQSKTKIFRAWQAAKGRCYNENNGKYYRYGARGIKVCAGLQIFYNFKNIVGEPPSSHHSLDRIDNDGNYSCGECDECIKLGWTKNVHWATAMQQANNKSSVRKYMYNGEKLCLAEISKIVNIPLKTICSRLKSKWEFEDAILTPVINRNMYRQLAKKYKNDISI